MVRRLILMRHAKSSWADDDAADIDRVLNGRGRKSCKAVGRWLREEGQIPDQVLCSSAARTRETWDRIAAELTDPPPVTEVPALYLAEPEVMLDVLQGATGNVVAMLGHNPGIGQMADRLLAEAPDHPDFERFPTLATLIADFDIDDWAEVSWGSGRAVDFVVPRALIEV